jgi:hypothetical protein
MMVTFSSPDGNYSQVLKVENTFDSGSTTPQDYEFIDYPYTGVAAAHVGGPYWQFTMTGFASDWVAGVTEQQYWPPSHNGFPDDIIPVGSKAEIRASAEQLEGASALDLIDVGTIIFDLAVMSDLLIGAPSFPSEVDSINWGVEGGPLQLLNGTAYSSITAYATTKRYNECPGWDSSNFDSYATGITGTDFISEKLCKSFEAAFTGPGYDMWADLEDGGDGTSGTPTSVSALDLRTIHGYWRASTTGGIGSDYDLHPQALVWREAFTHNPEAPSTPSINSFNYVYEKLIKVAIIHPYNGAVVSVGWWFNQNRNRFTKKVEIQSMNGAVLNMKEAQSRNLNPLTAAIIFQ